MCSSDLPVSFDKDEGPRSDTSMEVLGRLRPVMADGTVTAGNASSQNDAASVCLVVAADKLEETTMDLARKIAAKAPIPNRMVKGMMFRGLTQTLDDHLAEAAQAEVMTLSSQDHKEALAAFREGRTPVFKGE